MQSASQKRSVTALILGLALSALLLAVCNGQTPREQLRSLDVREDSPFAGASFSVRDKPAGLATSSVLPHPAAPTLGLTMADFTGDTHPDVAMVEFERADSANARYRIEIRLTEGRAQSLRLTAPFGGLLITTKDVTGDGNLDLIVHAAKTHALVAVFLNDGNGHFERADTASFAKTLTDEPFRRSLARKVVYLGSTVGCPESHVIERPRRSVRPLLAKNGLMLPPDYDASFSRFFPCSSNRAPPSLT
jgi:hypothetical protein